MSTAALWFFPSVADSAGADAQHPVEVSVDQLESFADAEVFLEVDATDQQISHVRQLIEKMSYVEVFAFVDKDDALRTYRRIQEEDPSTPPVASADELPTSY